MDEVGIAVKAVEQLLATVATVILVALVLGIFGMGLLATVLKLEVKETK